MPDNNRKNLPIQADLHREIKIASVHREQDMGDVVREAWECFKKVQGRNLHKSQAEERANVA